MSLENWDESTGNGEDRISRSKGSRVEAEAEAEKRRKEGYAYIFLLFTHVAVIVFSVVFVITVVFWGKPAHNLAGRFLQIIKAAEQSLLAGGLGLPKIPRATGILFHTAFIIFQQILRGIAPD